MIKWNNKEIKFLRSSACLHFLHNHDLYFSSSALTLDNCGACLLLGRNASDISPNYVGWEKLYVEAGKSIPLVWKKAFDAAIFKSGKDSVYQEELRKSINTFGYPKFYDHLTTPIQRSLPNFLPS